jgi:RHS repeat-associated protein
VASFDTDPYGNPTQSNGRVSTDFRYANLFYDQQDGLYLANYRAYDPKVGRWLSRDPLGAVGGLNLYSYVSGDPINLTDSLGFSWYTTLVNTAVDLLPESLVDRLAGGQQLLNAYQGTVEGFDPTPLSAWLYTYAGLQNNRCSEAFRAGYELGERTALIKDFILGLGELKEAYWAIEAERRIGLLIFRNGRWYGGQSGRIGAATVDKWTEELNHAIGGLFMEVAQRIFELDKKAADASKSCGCPK